MHELKDLNPLECLRRESQPDATVPILRKLLRYFVIDGRYQEAQEISLALSEISWRDDPAPIVAELLWKLEGPNKALPIHTSNQK